ncbi:SPFH domain-containing protein [Dokdonella sp.]|uniref:SPFH domain-containing protein n=1 Tax=Dokdonella sp. TaxID=2291710 RepID=UPI003529537C
MSISIISIMLVSLAALAAVCVRRIPEGQVYSLRRFGGHTRFVGAGMHFMLPLIERVSHKMSLTGSTIEVSGALSNGENYAASVYYQVLDPQRADQVIECVDALLSDQTTRLLAGDSVPPETAERRIWLKQGLNSEVRERGLLVTRIDLRSAA